MNRVYLPFDYSCIYLLIYHILFTPESNRMIKQNVLKSTVHTAALALLIQAGATTQAAAQAGVFEVIHPETEKGEVEIEVLNGIGLSDVDDGEERSTAMDTAMTDMTTMVLSRLGSLQLWKSRKKAVLATVPWK